METMIEIELGVADDLRASDGWSLVSANDTYVGVFAKDGVLHAYENLCPHQGGPVCRGKVMPAVMPAVAPDGQAIDTFSAEHRHLVCPWHGWEFELPSGRCVADPRHALRRLEVYERDGRAYVLAPEQLLGRRLNAVAAR